MTGTEVATVDDAALEALAAQQEEEFGDDLFQTPILKVGQATTREVRAEEAEQGEFINTLTGAGIGDKIGFIISWYQRGRFAANDDGRAFVSFDQNIPPAWADLVGDEFVDTPFTEYPDAEETYKIRVNKKEIEWGKGPLVSTTHNFTGLAIVSGVEGSDEPDELQPVRLSLKRTDMPAVRKILTLKKASLRNRNFWEKVFDLSTYKKEFTKGDSYLVSVKLGRDTTADERQQAVELAQAVSAGRVSDNAEAAAEGDKPVEPDAKGGLDV